MADATTVLIIRHADKPPAGGDGVDSSGARDEESLTTVGWQRAGVWAELFRPSFGTDSPLPTPKVIFASASGPASKSRRPYETVVPLALKLGIPVEKVDQRFSKGGESELAKAVTKLSGVVLISWQHENIVDITSALASSTPDVPTGWPGGRFNVIFRFDRAAGSKDWTFTQIVPVMLSGDVAAPITLDGL